MILRVHTVPTPTPKRFDLIAGYLEPRPRQSLCRAGSQPYPIEKSLEATVALTMSAEILVTRSSMSGHPSIDTQVWRPGHMPPPVDDVNITPKIVRNLADQNLSAQNSVLNFVAAFSMAHRPKNVLENANCYSLWDIYPKSK
jgi:hypothetical protein